MPFKEHSQGRRQSHASDASAEICKKNCWTPHQYAEFYDHFRGNARAHVPALAGRVRGTSKARTEGGRSGHTSRAASADGGGRVMGKKDRVRKRYEKACDYLRTRDDFDPEEFTREKLMAKAFELESLNDKTFLLDHLTQHGEASDAHRTAAKEMFPNLSTEPLTKKKLSERKIWGRKMALALYDMNAKGYKWFEKMSQSTLRAFVLQQCSGVVDERDMSLMQYIEKHQHPTDESSKKAQDMFKKDSKTIQHFTYEDRQSTGHYHTQRHGAAHSTMPADPDGMPRRAGGVPGIASVNSQPPQMGAYAHDDFGDVPDDYRV